MTSRLVIFVGLAASISCQNQEAETTTKVKDPIPAKVEDTVKVEDPIPPFDPEAYAKQIDSLLAEKKGTFSRYAWFENGRPVQKLAADSFDGEEIFVIFQNEAGFIQYIGCFPQSQSGDWFEVEEYIFDTTGRTVRHKFHHSTFVSDNCGESRINIIRWFDKNSVQVKEDRKQSDFEERVITDRNCFPHLVLKSAANMEDLLSRPGLRKVVEKVRKAKH